MGAIQNDWLEAIGTEFGKSYYKELYEFVKKEYETTTVFPPSDDIFNALHLTALKDVGSNSRAGPLSWRQPGTWTIFFRAARTEDSAVLKKYLSGTS